MRASIIGEASFCRVCAVITFSSAEEKTGRISRQRQALKPSAFRRQCARICAERAVDAAAGSAEHSIPNETITPVVWMGA